jgi:uncharacterized membrane protein
MWDQGYGAAPWTRVVVVGVWLALVLVVVAAVAVAVWFLARRGQRTTPGWAPGVEATAPQPYASSVTATGSGPLTILDERLARGEIDVDTYRAVRAELAPAAHRAQEDSQSTQSVQAPG